ATGERQVRTEAPGVLREVSRFALAGALHQVTVKGILAGILVQRQLPADRGHTAGENGVKRPGLIELRSRGSIFGISSRVEVRVRKYRLSRISGRQSKCDVPHYTVSDRAAPEVDLGESESEVQIMRAARP